MSTLPLTLEQKIHYLHPEGREQVLQAYLLADRAHEGMRRRSGEPYIMHPVAVTELLADMHLDADALVAGLLHDTVEDTDVTFEQIESEFGTTVRRIVEGETKISKLTVRVYEDEQSENLRQMLLAMVKDVRIILVKLADRLHNMRTLKAMPEAKQKKISLETLEIFAPLAHRLGINHIKTELEELAFYYLEPERYETLQRQVRMHQNDRETYVQRSIGLFEERLRAEGLEFEVSGRSKNLYSVQRKMERDGKNLDQIFDLMAIRVIIETSAEIDTTQEKALCYRALGIAHSLWAPIPGRFKDYVAVPKANGYQSLHTTVIGLQGQPIEVQIRTRRMHELAEYGVAAHWAYKQGIQSASEVEKRLEWMKQLLDVDNSVESAGAFVDTVKHDLLSERVLVFTPKGDVINLPFGSTPIDFAYHVHTNLGHECEGARINGEMVPLHYRLQTGDRVEIIRRRNATPSSGWMNVAVTRSAKQKIRQYFRQQEKQEHLEQGRKSLERALRRKQLPLTQYAVKGKLEAAAKTLLNSHNLDELYLALHSKRLTPKQVLEVLAPETKKAVTTPAPSRPRRSLDGIYVDGLDAPAKLSQCCSPVRGDDVVGYVTRGSGISVHRCDCPNVKNLMRRESERFVSVTWDAPSGEVYPVDFEVIGVDRPGLMKDVMAVLESMNKSAPRVSAGVENNTTAYIQFRVDVKDHSEIEYIKDSVGRVPDVTRVYRAKPGFKG